MILMVLSFIMDGGKVQMTVRKGQPLGSDLEYIKSSDLQREGQPIGNLPFLCVCVFKIYFNRNTFSPSLNKDGLHFLI